MLEVDGGEGGGQLLRSSLALAALTGRAVRISAVRGNRPEPGLKPQHLTAVETLAAVCRADVEGATAGSTDLVFDPGRPQGGHLEVDIGTAGSVTLLFDAVLPLAAALGQPLSVTATGGTEVKWSPPLATYRTVRLPLARRAGLHATVERQETGFYPAGGGRATLHLAPSAPTPLSLTDRGALVGARIVSRASQDLAARDVHTRQAGAARSKLQEAGIEVVEAVTAAAETASTGSALTVVLDYEHSRAGFDALGEPGKRAETVATEAVEAARTVHGGTAAVDRHTADQLLVVLALAGGAVRIPEVTSHVESSLDVLDTFGFEVAVEESGSTSTVTAAGR
jgi:RNA 3'-terminal phosphate cyclase (ATP)